MKSSAKKLLLVDDDVTFSNVLGRALMRRGFEVVTANDVKSAAKTIHANMQFAIIDLLVGRGSGLDLLPKLKAANPDMSIILLTGYASIATAIDAIKLGATNYLAKPADIDAILKAFDISEPSTAARTTEAMAPLDHLEWEHIQRALLDNGGNVSATARALRMHRRSLQRKLAKNSYIADREIF